MTKRTSVKVTNAALEKVQGTDTVILRGAIDPDSLDLLQVDDYQREVLNGRRIQSFQTALGKGSVPDIDLGMRGEKFRVVPEDDGSDTIFLQNQVFIVDGLQRVSAARRMSQDDKAGCPHLGAKIYFGTNKEWEKNRFEVLNDRRTKVSPNILIRNLADDFSALEMLSHLCLAKEFALYKRVSWGQRQKTNEIMNIRTLARMVMLLHKRYTTKASATKPRDIAESLQQIMEKVGRTTMRKNIIAFFDVIDGAWSIRNITYKEHSTHIKSGFMIALATVFVDYEHVYWNGHSLTIDKQTRNKLKQFNLADPYVKELSIGKDQKATLLAELIVNHINKGRRTRRLVR